METPKKVDPLEFISAWVNKILEQDEERGCGEDPEYYSEILDN